MNKSELIAAVAKKAELSKKDAEKAVNAFIDSVKATVAKKNKVQLIGFGTFESRARKARTGKNPRTGETIKIAKATVPAFKAGKAFKDAVNKKK
ncbi:MAG: HU family DNA-binding protein [Acidaminococcaceae bacterium]|nr:HU family DNA-binding protein [Acidaminococcaceae bacterium]